MEIAETQAMASRSTPSRSDDIHVPVAGSAWLLVAELRIGRGKDRREETLGAANPDAVRRRPARRALGCAAQGDCRPERPPLYPGAANCRAFPAS